MGRETEREGEEGVRERGWGGRQRERVRRETEREGREGDRERGWGRETERG